MRADPLARLLMIATLTAGAALAGCGYDNSPMGEPTTRAAGEDGRGGKGPLRIGGYVAGSVHPANVETVFVEMFASQEFRRELEFRLTEAVQKRILSDTPYKLAKKPQADTILYGELLRVPVTLLSNDFDSDLPAENQIVLVVNWTWKNRRTGEILAQRRGMQQAGEYIPLAGEQFFDGSEEAINDLAERIVEGMEADW